MRARVVRCGRRATAILLGLTATLAPAAASYAAGSNHLTANQAKLITRIDNASEHAPHALTTYPDAAQSWYASFHPTFTVHYEHGKVLSFGIAGKPGYWKSGISDRCWEKQQESPLITEVTAATVMLPGPDSAGVTYTFPKPGIIHWRQGKPDTGSLPPASGAVNYDLQTLRIMSGAQETGRYRLSYTVNYTTVRHEPKIPTAKAICPRSSEP